MNRTSLLAALVVSLLVSPALAQTSFDRNWSSNEKGLTVASSQKVVARPTKLRLFATLATTDTDVKKAVTKLAESKKATIEKLLAMEVKKDAIKITETRIREWEEKDQNGMMGGMGGMGMGGMGMFNVADDPFEEATPTDQETPEEEQYTAYAAVLVDWEIKDIGGDELILKCADLRDQIRKNGVLMSDEKASDFSLVVVGEISDDAATDALKRCYDEANARAKKIATITGRPLGKLEAMVLRKDGNYYWSGDYDTDTSYSAVRTTDSELPSPMSAFHRSPTEVCASRASELYGVYTIELRFELK